MSSRKSFYQNYSGKFGNAFLFWSAIFVLWFGIGVNNVNAQAITEGFDDVTTLPAAGWAQQNNSAPVGTFPTWFQGDAATWTAQTGPTNSWVGVNFNSVAGGNTISNWLFTPNRTLNNGDVFRFWTRRVNLLSFPDRLEVRLSTAGASINVGTTNESVGDFTQRLLVINEGLTQTGYPFVWTEYTINLSNLAGPTSGRLAFRYYVTDGGPLGNNSNLIGIDTFSYTPAGAVAPRTPFDFDGDGRADLSVFRSSNTNWYANRSTAGFLQTQFGLASDKLAPADYDGDGKTDIAVWRESNGNFYILNSSNNSVRIENFGLTGDVLTVGDWDGDGKAELSTYRNGAQSYFYYRGSLNNPSGNITYLPWGTSGDKPMRGDFDGDGKFDTAVYRGSNQTCYIRNSSNNQVVYQPFGISTDSFVPADYDGDGKTDLAVYRPSNSTWYILQSSNNQVRYQRFGQAGDQPVPADYDGDGKADIAIYRSGVWWILRSSDGGFSATTFGLSSDTPIQSAYLQ